MSQEQTASRMVLLTREEHLEKALREAISAAEYVIRLCEDDVRAGESPNPVVKSCPSAALGHCYAAMSFVTEARQALAR